MLAHIHLRRLTARALTLLLAAQMSLAGLCLMPAQAMPVVQHEHGGQVCQTEDGQQRHAMQHACYHCVQPDAQVSPAIFSIQADAPTACMVARPAASEARDAGLLAHRPTGPPRSASLIYRYTQRIRI